METIGSLIVPRYGSLNPKTQNGNQALCPKQARHREPSTPKLSFSAKQLAWRDLGYSMRPSRGIALDLLDVG